jgi:hypothetical protein
VNSSEKRNEKRANEQPDQAARAELAASWEKIDANLQSVS